MKPADIAAFRIPGAPALAPDGASAVVAVTRIDLDADDYRSRLWLVPTGPDGDARAITQGWADSSPAYSPDGKWLAYLRKPTKDDKPQIAVLPVGGGEPRTLTDHPLGAGAPVWSPDSTAIAYAARVPEEGRYGTEEKINPGEEPPRRITTLAYRVDGVGFTNDRRRHVFTVDPFTEDAKPVQLTDGDQDDTDPAWSPDGSTIAFTSARHEGRDFDLRNDVHTVPAGGGDVVKVTDTTLGVFKPGYSADGATIYFLAEDTGENGRDFVGQNVGLWSVPASGGTPTRLTDAATYQAADGGSPLTLTEDGVLFEAEVRGAVDLLLVPFDGGEPRQLLAGQHQVSGHAYANGVLVASVADPETSGELVRVEGGEKAPLTDLGADFAKTVGVLPMRELDATAPDGYPVHGWLVRPDGPGPHPVLLMIHGGPFAQYGWRLFDEAQVYAGAGYAVVMGNPRGSSGYGEAHGKFIKSDVGEKSSADLYALLDHALEVDPDLDRTRMGVLGGSHGGFMTTWIAGNSDRFKAAITERAVNALDSFRGASDIGWFFADELYGEDLDNQARQSPLTSAKNITIPTLIIHSEQDWRCPLEQAQRLFVQLKQQGVQTEFLLFPGEGHELSRSGLPSHRIARFDAILDWFSRYV